MGEVLKNIEEIENYFEGKLSLEDKLLFEAKLESNADLVAEFDLYKQIRGAIVEKGKVDLKSKFALVDKELDNNQTRVIPISKKRNYKTLAIAASVLIVVGLSIFFLLNKKNDYSQLASKYYEAEKGLPVEMGASNKFDNLMNFYKSGNYNDAKKLMDEMLKMETTNDTLIYFNAVISEELKNYRPAINNYTRIPSTSNYFQKAQYRLALTYLKSNDKNNAIEIINQALSNKEHLYYEKLSQLRVELTK